MTYKTFTLPATFAAVKSGEVVAYQEATKTDATLPAQAKVASVEMVPDEYAAASAFDAAATAATIGTRLGKGFSVANLCRRFVPLGSNVWAGITPGDQYVSAPIQIEFGASGAVKIRVHPDWLDYLQGQKLLIAYET